MPAMRRGSLFLCCCGFGVRWWRGYCEARSRIGVAFSDIYGGFPVSAGGDGIRLLPGSGCKVEVALLLQNKFLRPSLHFVVFCSGTGDGFVRLGGIGFGICVDAPLLVASWLGVFCWSTVVILGLGSSSSLVGLLGAFLCLLLLLDSAGQVEVSGWDSSMILTADAWLRGMCCSLPLFGVGFSIWGADGGWSLFRCVIRAEMRQRSGELRKMNRCISLDWFVISIIFRVLAVRFGCTVLFFLF